MANVRQQFEAELRTKLQQKATPHKGEEQVLMQSFKYFDLDNSGAVDLQEFVKTVEKIGVVVQSLEEIQALFNFYDVDKSGALDYKEFSAIIFGNQSAQTRKMTPQQSGLSQDQMKIEKALTNFRNKLATRGARGIIGLQRQFKIMDDDDSKSLDIYEFTKAIKDYRIDIPEGEIQIVFNSFDRDRNGTVDYDEFLRGVRGPMNAFRKAIVAQAFAKLDKDGSGVIDVNDVRGVYNAKQHPDVQQGKKTEDEILLEFLETFEMHHNLIGNTVGDHVITQEEFEEYYNNISMSIDNDEYFKLMMSSTWKLGEHANVVHKKGEVVVNKSMNQAFGATPETRSLEAEKTKVAARDAEISKGAAKPIPAGLQNLFEKFRGRLIARGSRGIIGLQRSFKIMDDNRSMSLDVYEFTKACKDFRVEISESDLGKLFQAFDRDGSGEVSYDEFLRAVRGPMNNFRKALVSQAFRKLDKDGSGVIDINDIKGVYDAKNHPDVKAGKRSEEDILGDFLETFEMHHNICDQAGNDQIITLEEFEEYYNNVSMSIDDDKYFELMMTNAWKLKGEGSNQKGWAGQVGGRGNYSEDRKKAWASDMHKSVLTGSVASSAPYGTFAEPGDYSTSNNPGQVSEVHASKEPSKPRVAGQSSTEELVDSFRSRLLQRGARGIIGLQRQFKIMDDNNNKTLELTEFAKAIKDFRIDIPSTDVARVFKYFDRDGSGNVDYDELLRVVRGPMNTFRKNLVTKAFQKIDKDGSGVLELNDLKGVYNASNHPDVKAGKKTEEEVLCEFLDTFEMHHSLATGGTGRDSRVTPDEWMEYYNNVSCSIDNDQYFELMMKNAWNLDNKPPVKKAWGSDMTSPPKKSRF